MILMATARFLFRSRACTTLPKVPCPRRRLIWSVGRGQSLSMCCEYRVERRTVFGEVSIGHDNEVALVIIDLDVFVIVILRQNKELARVLWKFKIKMV